ncbi:hypothetical protein [Fimbriimonas ginsengisoli]|uniref:Uncharacterized protein n=1 Tax=Fimbriimonas ginsengisoli Gsoil 348 TaxID=661478 RepID=A0A068NXK0_FIMGI|nr:hypothetical protein [Fimbriimonas ginsengisoli]AIE88161.1 hypothetical protein OP10G_4793 [Fimbriimonas ginsengisoli Gsoil 348]
MSVAPLDRTATTNTTVIDRPLVQPRRSPLPRTKPSRRPTVAPEIRVRARVVSRQKSNAAAQAWGLRAVAFLGIFTGTYVASALLGQVMVEGARRQEIAARERASDAARVEAALSDKVFALKSATFIEGWAVAHQFVPPDAAIQKKAEAPTEVEKSRYVASR